MFIFQKKFSANYSSTSKGAYNITKGISLGEIEEITNDPYLEVILIGEPLFEQDYSNLESLIFSKGRNVFLCKYNKTPAPLDLDFLKFFPSVKKLRICDAIEITNFENILLLNHIEEFDIDNCGSEVFNILERINLNLKKLTLGKCLLKKLNVSVVSRFSNLEYLYLEGHSKGLDSIATLKNLKELILRSCSAPNINFVQDLKKLWSVDIKLGVIKDLSALGTLTQLKYLEIWRIRKLSDLSFISQMFGLQNLLLESLINIDAIPNLDKLKSLRRIKLMNMKGLKQFNALKTAPNLQDFFYTEIYQQTPEDLLPVLENPNLKNVYVYFMNEAKNTTFHNLAASFEIDYSNWADFVYE